MVENQHRKITGYRDLTEEEIAAMNRVKAAEAEIAKLHQEIVAIARSRAATGVAEYDDGVRQASIAKTEFEGAFMRLARAVANPATPWRN